MYRHFATLIIEHVEKLSKAMTNEIEDMARLLAPALVGEGHIYFLLKANYGGYLTGTRRQRTVSASRKNTGTFPRGIRYAYKRGPGLDY